MLADLRRLLCGRVHGGRLGSGLLRSWADGSDLLKRPRHEVTGLQLGALPEQQRRASIPLGCGHRPDTITAGCTEQLVAILVHAREGHAKALEEGPVLRRRPIVAAQGEVNDAVAIPLEGLHRVGAVAVEERQPTFWPAANVHRHLLVLREALEVQALVVLRPVVQLSTCEGPERLDQRGAKVVLVPVQLRRVVAVEVQRREPEGLRLLGQPVVEPLDQQLHHLRVEFRRRRDVDAAEAVPDEAQGVGPDPLLALGDDVGPGGVLHEGPLLEGGQHVLVRDPATLALGGLQAGLRLTLRDEAVRAEDGGVRCPKKVLVVQAEVLGELLVVPAVDDAVHLGQRGCVRTLDDVDGLSPHGTLDLDEAAFVVPAPVRWVAAELQGLADGHRP
mmetsp:Transcript_7573/g.20971  ORF Transcript_7573/g.20971 Transcript_7573/m.20971 type:complete len:389 (+) Transcript_7573:604-1770(+)